MFRTSALARGSAAIFLLALASCSAVIRHPVPEETTLDEVVGVPGQIRYWGDEPPQALQAIVQKIGAHQSTRKNTATAVNFLALSGGGEDGAFGAGVLVGWTETGTRPQFDIVTGISTGALIAPFAFLGTGYDAALKEAYTTHEPSTIIRFGGLATIIGSAAVVDNSPLVHLVDAIVTPEILAAVAEQYRRGRLLLIGTTHLDAQRPVIWDMGAIAMQGDETALKLFRKVLIASASIPAAFPPVFISVRHDGQMYDEMHVDGGVSREVFLFPAAIDLRYFETRRMRSLPKRIYIIRNAKLGPEWQAVDPNLLKIGQRSVSTLIKYQGWGDLNRIYLQCQASGFDFNLASIPRSFDVAEREVLEIPYRRALFEFGYEIARHGYPWRKYPPDLTPQQRQPPGRLLSSLLPD